jgi:hypothetical protein
VARRDYTYGSAGDCTITFSLTDPEGLIVAPSGSMHLNLATNSIWLKTDGIDSIGWELTAGGGGGLPDGDYGDVTISGSGTLITINDGVITYDKIQDVSGPSIVLGRLSSGPGDIEEIPFSSLAAALGITSTPSGNALLSGGGVAWLQNLDFAVSAATYLIQGSQYSSPATNVTLTTANPTNPRIDVIAVNTSGAVVTIAGTPAVSPEKPDVDPSTQLELTFVYVPALATAPTVTISVIYRENAEWVTSKSGTPINLASTVNPYAGVLDVEATAAVTGNFANFVAPAAFDPNSQGSLVLRIRSKAAWPSTRLLNLNLRSATANKGTTIVLKDGVYGFNSAVVGAYQTIVIPVTDFGAGGLSVNAFRVTVGGSGTAIGFYLDNIELQVGLIPVASGDLVIRGAAWSNSSGIVLAEAKPVTVYFPKAAIIRRCVLIGDVAGNATIDVRKTTLAGLPATGANSICPGVQPALAAALYLDNFTLTGWTLPVEAGSVLSFVLTAVSGLSSLSIQLSIEN